MKMIEEKKFQIEIGENCYYNLDILRKTSIGTLTFEAIIKNLLRFYYDKGGKESWGFEKESIKFGV